MSFPLAESNPEALGLDPRPLGRLCALIERHIAEGHHPGAQVALARHGKLALFRSFGRARVAPDRPADDRTLFLMYSNTKVVTAAAVWLLAEEGLLRFTDTVAQHPRVFPVNSANGRHPALTRIHVKARVCRPQDGMRRRLETSDVRTCQMMRKQNPCIGRRGDAPGRANLMQRAIEFPHVGSQGCNDRLYGTETAFIGVDNYRRASGSVINMLLIPANPAEGLALEYLTGNTADWKKDANWSWQAADPNSWDALTNLMAAHALAAGVDLGSIWESTSE